mgnify:CR=1 FL=1
MAAYPDPDPMPASGELMDLLKDDEQRQEAIAAEDAFEGHVFAGTLHPIGWMKTWPGLVFLSEFAEVRSLVLRGFAQMIRDGNLGIGQEAAVECGKHLVYERMMQASTVVQELILELVDWENRGLREPLTDEQMTVLKGAFREVLTDEDWDEIATAAARQVQQQVMALVGKEVEAA